MKIQTTAETRAKAGGGWQRIDNGPSPAEIERQREEAARQQRLATAHAQNDQGLNAWKKGDWAAAANYFEQALQNSPDDQTIKSNLDKAQQKLKEQQDNKTAANHMQQIVKSLTFTPASTTSGLDFNGFNANKPFGDSGNAGGLDFNSFNAANPQPNSGQKVVTGTFGTKVAKPDLGPAHSPSTVGTDTKAGDQLLSAAAAGKKGKDLTQNFDAGTAKKAGSLVYARSHSIDMSTFSERARNDPLIISTVKELDALQAKRSQLETERNELIKQRNAATDPAAMKKLSEQVNHKDKDYQANLADISKKTQLVEKRHREIDTKVDSSNAKQQPKGAP
jgi:hypothetical protein